MNRVLAAAVAATIGAGLCSAPASAATPTQRIAKLERLVKSQQKEIKTLKTRVREAEEVGGAALLFAVCSSAVTADAFISTWGTLNQVAGRTAIAAQTPVSDPACTRLRVPRAQPVPPTIDPFAQLMRLLNPFSAVTTVFRQG